ncbi:hypothetical protein [Actinomyces qiguomingii]|uniref:hypothetical protein n=1 Tax=Actinomyces qiguomingii TaxID=2057800 RepID=UPI001304DB0B|nr:hypothetical protein [Actinomyces qiguomingii]
MSEPAHRPSPEPTSADVPQWIYDLVPIAAHARALLRAGAPALLVAMGIVLVVPQLVAYAASWVAVVCTVLGSVMALRHGGPSASAAAASNAHVRAATARIQPEADGVGNVQGAPGAPAKASPSGIAAGGLRPGGRTAALLVVLDLLLTATGTAALAGLALAGADRPLLVAAAGAATGLTAGVGAVAAMELRGGRTLGALVWLGAFAVAIIVAVAYVYVRFEPTWWWVLAMAIVVDGVGLLALRAGARADRAGTRSGTRSA